jgi:hypothetical protein
MSTTNLYFTHLKMKHHLQKIKRINSEARILGLDLGRKYVGVSVSDRTLSSCRPYKTYLIDPQLFK